MPEEACAVVVPVRAGLLGERLREMLSALDAMMFPEASSTATATPFGASIVVPIVVLTGWVVKTNFAGGAVTTNGAPAVKVPVVSFKPCPPPGKRAEMGAAAAPWGGNLMSFPPP